jgi:CRP-like cAMP-binding protein
MEKIRRKTSKYGKGISNYTIPLTADLDMKHRLNAITESIKLLRKKSHHVPYANFDPTFSDEKSLDVLIDILKKENRTGLDINIIYIYLKQLTEFMNKLQASDSNQDELIYKISLALKHQHVDENRLIFKYGDRGDCFYILLKGKIDILKPTEHKIMMSEEEYIRYILKLKKNDEIELVNAVMNLNRNIFSIDDVLENWLNENNNANKSTIYHKKSFLHSMLSKDIEETMKIMNSRKFKSEINDTEVTVEEYIRKSTADVNLKNNEVERKQVTVITYIPIHTLRKGDQFGEQALESALQKRKASLIASEDTDLGVINKKSYLECLKDITDQVRKKNVAFLVSTKLFENVNKVFFQKFLNNFSIQKISRNSKIIEEGEKPESIYIIKEGEFEVYTKKSTLMLTDIIQGLGGKVNNFQDIFDMDGKILI